MDSTRLATIDADLGSTAHCETKSSPPATVSINGANSASAKVERRGGRGRGRSDKPTARGRAAPPQREPGRDDRAESRAAEDDRCRPAAMTSVAFDEILRRLVAAGAEFVVIGGLAPVSTSFASRKRRRSARSQRGGLFGGGPASDEARRRTRPRSRRPGESRRRRRMTTLFDPSPDSSAG